MSVEVHIVFSADKNQRPSISERKRLEYEVRAATATSHLAHAVPDIVTGKQRQEIRQNGNADSPQILAC